MSEDGLSVRFMDEFTKRYHLKFTGIDNTDDGNIYMFKNLEKEAVGYTRDKIFEMMDV